MKVLIGASCARDVSTKMLKKPKMNGSDLGKLAINMFSWYL